MRRQIQYAISILSSNFTDAELEEFLCHFSKTDEFYQNFCYGLLLQLKTRGRIELCSKCCHILCVEKNGEMNLSDFLIQANENSSKIVKILIDVKYIKNDVTFINGKFVSGNVKKFVLWKKKLKALSFSENNWGSQVRDSLIWLPLFESVSKLLRMNRM